MRAVIQRVLRAEVSIEDKVVGEIGPGLLVFLGIEEGDSRTDADYICSKTVGLRVFDDTEGVPNLSVDEIGGSILLVSQFTLCADARKGRRPSYIHAARPEEAKPLYSYCIEEIKKRVPVETGQFQAEMQVSLVNSGPHTILLDSRRKF
jgi:D-tyrosyl-tRNA(Tyr) deacylase